MLGWFLNGSMEMGNLKQVLMLSYNNNNNPVFKSLLLLLLIHQVLFQQLLSSVLN